MQWREQISNITGIEMSLLSNYKPIVQAEMTHDAHLYGYACEIDEEGTFK